MSSMTDKAVNSAQKYMVRKVVQGRKGWNALLLSIGFVLGAGCGAVGYWVFKERVVPEVVRELNSISAYVPGVSEAKTHLAAHFGGGAHADVDPESDVQSVESAYAVLRYWFSVEGGKSAQELFKMRWFPLGPRQQQADAFIKEHFGAVLAKAERGELQHWREAPLTLVALIVVLDQFSRHVYRGQECLYQNDEHALALALELRSRGWDVHLGLAQQIFALMPLRHARTDVNHLGYVVDQIPKLESASEALVGLIRKFRLQSVRALRLAEMNELSMGHFEDKDILERVCDLEVSDADMFRDPLVKAMDVYLTAKASSASSSSSSNDGEAVPVVCVSLSGGVDSMVIARILCYLAQKKKKFRVAACHVCYNNRPEAALEMDYLRWYCQELDIELHSKDITDIKRGGSNVDRDAYEKMTRDYRYQLYLDVQAALGFGGVIFGHHVGDVQENVMSNFMCGKSLLNLNGMTESSLVNGVCIWRPLLGFDKDAIYHFAHKYGVPYFKDTTPSWATRGQLRNGLFPLLRDMYGSGSLRALSSLGEQSAEVKQLLTTACIGPFLDGVHRAVTGLHFDMVQYRDMPLLFWKECVMELMHGCGMSKVREKPLRELLSKIDRRRNQSRKTKSHENNRGKSPHTASAHPIHPFGSEEGRGVPNEIVPLKKENTTYLFEGRLVVFWEKLEHAWRDDACVKGLPLTPRAADDVDDAPCCVVNDRWEVRVQRVELKTGAEELNRPVTVQQVLAGQVEYWLGDFGEGFKLDYATPKKLFKRLGRPLRLLLPLVVAVGDNPLRGSQKDRRTPLSYVRVQLTYIGPVKHTRVS